MILSTKLFRPPSTGSLIYRHHLTQCLLAGIDRTLTLVSAPAGFGKSTLLSTWAAEVEQTTGFSVGWLSLDEQDNLPAQFWAYIVAAWQAALPDTTVLPEQDLDQFRSLLKADESVISGRIVGMLVNLMVTVPKRVLLILDDYHRITNPEIHAAVAQWIERLPANVRLAIATRFDPPLPIPRLRVRDQISEIRTEDLRFTTEEILDLLQQSSGLTLTPADITSIEASTEGWIAGLKMAALALGSQRRSPEEARQFWASFTGRNIYILDYLTEEVLCNLPEDVQDFLIKSSILDRLSEGLCAEVVFGSSVGIPQARVVLQQLERANLFLIPLDQERTWFRYHHLFADLLKVRLQQAGENVSLLHQRASKWFEQQDLIGEAVHHAIAAQDWENAARLMEDHVNEYLDRGQLGIVLQWVDSLPDHMLRLRPNLCIQIAWALGHAGKTQRVPPLLTELEAALQAWQHQPQPALHMTERDAQRIRGSLAFFRGYTLILSARPDQALLEAENALESLPDLETRERSWLNWMVGYAQRGLGNLEQAAQYFRRAVEISRGTGAVWEDLATDLGVVYRLCGWLDDAARVFEDSLQWGAELGLQNKGNLSRVEAYLSAVRMEQNRVEEALAHARTAIHYLQWWPSHNHISTAYAFYGLALISTGRLEEAASVIDRASQEHRQGQVTPFVTRLVESARVRLWLAQEDRRALSAWIGEQPVSIPANPGTQPYNEYEEMRLTTLARAWMDMGRWTNDIALVEKAIPLLGALAESAWFSRRTHAEIEINALYALALWELARPGNACASQALERLTRSLMLGLPAGYRRIYLDQSAALNPLLRSWLEKDQAWIQATGVPVGLVYELLDEPPESPAKPDGLIEPLTDREKDVLKLLALGCSNREMAERLVVSEGTIKTHVHNLIGKLGASSRTQALARARELHLLS